MKLTLRVTVMTMLLVLLLSTVVTLGIFGYRNARATAEDLSTQILEQTAVRVDGQLNELLLTANEQGEVSRALLEGGQFRIDDFPRLAAYWIEVLRVHPKLTRIAYGVDATGELFYVKRTSHEKLAIGEIRRNASTGRLELREYWPGDHPKKPFYVAGNRDEDDARDRPWYRSAQPRGRQTWSESYAFWSDEGGLEAPGVACATPVRDADQRLVGILGVRFDLVDLCHFLHTLPVGRQGYAFVVEFRHDGTERVIAHPTPEILLRVIGEEGSIRTSELVPPEEVADGRVWQFLQQLPPGLNPTHLKGMTRVQFVHEGTRYLGGYTCLSTSSTPDWLICVLLPEEDVLGYVQRSNRLTLFIGLCVVGLAVLGSLYFAAQIARPLEQLARESDRIGHLEFSAAPPPRSIVREVDCLALATEEMKTGLRSFQKYVPADLVRSLLAAGQEANLGGEKRHLTIFFCDVADFTALSERLAPEALVAHLGEYLSALTTEIEQAGGTVDKYIGDAIMAFWGAPAVNPAHAEAACRAALRCQQRLAELQVRWQAEGKPIFSARVGINTGDVVVGNIGSAARLNYTVMGDAVNVASRLEGLNKYFGTAMLISELTYREAAQAVVARPLDWVSVKGRTEAGLVYELLGLSGDVSDSVRDLAKYSAEALAAYRERQWKEAIGLFEKILQILPQDGPAREMIARCRSYELDPPPPSWDGVHRMDRK